MAPQLPGKEYFALEAKAIFEKIDDDGSEVIDLEEITEAIAETDINLSEEEIEAMVERIDDDDSGAIDLDEFTEWWLANKKERIALFGPLQAKMEHEAAHRKKRAQIEEQAEALFQTIDEDESGTLDTMEMAWALAEALRDANLSPQAMKAQVDAAVAEMDDDRSGGIDRDEFFDWCAEHQDKMNLMTKHLIIAPQQKKAPAGEETTSHTSGGVEKLDEANEAGEQKLRTPPPLPTRESVAEQFGMLRSHKVKEDDGAKALEIEAKQLFDSVDEDGSGILEEEEVGLLAAQVGVMLTGSALKCAMEEMDDDGGGMIEYTEFLAWWIGKKRNGEDLFAAVQARALELKQQKKEDKAKRQEARDMFDLYDVDQGGMLDRDEVKALAEALGTKLRGREIDKAMAVMDEDGSGEVDFDEFFEWWIENGGRKTGGMFTAFTNKGHLARLASKVEDHAQKKPPPFRQTLAYQEFVERDKHKASRTTTALERSRLDRGFFLQNAFNRFDTDGSDGLDRSEVRALIVSLGIEPTEAQLENAMMGMDEDGSGEVNFDEFKSWWEANLDAKEGDASPMFSELRKKISEERDQKGGAIKALRKRLWKFTGRFNDDDMKNLRKKEDEIDGRIAFWTARLDELNAKLAGMVAVYEGRRPRFVPRFPEGYDDWPEGGWKRREWIKKERNRRDASDPWPVEEKPPNFDKWPILAQREWEYKQEMAHEAMERGSANVSMFLARAVGFSEMSLSWNWPWGDNVQMFYIFMATDKASLHAIEAAPEAIPRRALLSVAAVAGAKEYKHHTMKYLQGAKNYQFGIVALMELPAKGVDPVPTKLLPMLFTNETTDPVPKVEHFEAASLGFAEMALSWKWTSKERVEKFTLYRRLDSEPESGEGGEGGVGDGGPMEKLQDVAFVDGQRDFGPVLMFPLWPPPGATYTFGIVTTMENGFVCPEMQLCCHELKPAPELDFLDAITLGFAEIELQWGWSSDEPALKFSLFRDAGDSVLHADHPNIFIKDVYLHEDPTQHEYTEHVVFPLWPPAELTFTFGVLVHMRNGLVLPMRSVRQRTRPEPAVDYLTATTLSSSAISLSWGWTAPDRVECFRLLRNKGNQELSRELECLDVAEVVVEDPEQPDYADQIVRHLGPRGLCSLSSGVEYTFAVSVKMKNGLILPTVRCTGWTAPRTFLDWSEVEVAKWVGEVVGYPQYAAVFEEQGVSGTVAAVLSGEDLELDLGISAWSPRMALLLAIQTMVDRARAFGPGAIGYDGRAASRVREPRHGPLWDALRETEGETSGHWWHFVEDVIYDGADEVGDAEVGQEAMSRANALVAEMEATAEAHEQRRLIGGGGGCWPLKDYEEPLLSSRLTVPTPFADLAAFPHGATPPLTPLVPLGGWSGRLRSSFFEPLPRADTAAAAGRAAVQVELVALEKEAMVDVTNSLELGGAVAGRSNVRRLDRPCLAAALKAGVYEGPANISELYVATNPAAAALLAPSPLEARRRVAVVDAAGGAGLAKAPLRGELVQMVRRKPEQPFAKWEPAQVAAWLRAEYGAKGTEWARAFVAQGVGGELATVLEADDLENDLGVALLDCDELLRAIAERATHGAVPHTEQEAAAARVATRAAARMDDAAKVAATEHAVLAEAEGRMEALRTRLRSEPLQSALGDGESLDLSHRGLLPTPAMGGRRAVAASTVTSNMDEEHWWSFVRDVSAASEDGAGVVAQRGAQGSAGNSAQGFGHYAKLLDGVSMHEIRPPRDRGGAAAAAAAWHGERWAEQYGQSATNRSRLDEGASVRKLAGLNSSSSLLATYLQRPARQQHGRYEIDGSK